MPHCKSCGKPFEIKTEGYHSGLCEPCEDICKGWWLADPAFAKIAAECQRRYGRIWLTSEVNVK